VNKEESGGKMYLDVVSWGCVWFICFSLFRAGWRTFPGVVRALSTVPLVGWRWPPNG